MNISEWLTVIQGKKISTDVIENVARILDLSNEKLSNKQLYEKIVGILIELRYQDDAKHTLAKYLYEHFLGYHIDPLDLATENLVIIELNKLIHVKNVPHIYMLQKISDKFGLNIRKTVEYTKDKQQYYDDLLKFYIEI